MIGSQIIKNLVNDTKDSFTYFQQSFDLISQTSNVFKGNKVKKSSAAKKEEFKQKSVTQNIPKIKTGKK